MNSRSNLASPGHHKHGPKKPFPQFNPCLEMNMALVRQVRLEDSIFNEHLGKEVLVIDEFSERLHATLSIVGKDFVKLTNVRLEHGRHVPPAYELYGEMPRTLVLNKNGIHHLISKNANAMECDAELGSE